MIDWPTTATKIGYADEEAMWKALYGKHSIAELSTMLGVSRNTVRLRLVKCGIEFRGRGGPNNKHTEVTDDLLDRVKRDGIAVVAKELGIQYSTLYKRIYRIRGLKIADLKVPEEPPKAEES